MTTLDTRNRIPVFEHERISVWYYPGSRIIHHSMTGPVLGDIFRTALTAGAKAMMENHGHKWLSDDRLNGALLPNDLEWVDKVWHRQAVDAGWTHWALLPPTSVVGQMNIRKHISLYKERGIMVEVFTDLGKAMAWLEDQG
jgi:hypothetical protein